jgi:hypothetical protein
MTGKEPHHPTPLVMPERLGTIIGPSSASDGPTRNCGAVAWFALRCTMSVISLSQRLIESIPAPCAGQESPSRQFFQNLISGVASPSAPIRTLAKGCSSPILQWVVTDQRKAMWSANVIRRHRTAPTVSACSRKSHTRAWQAADGAWATSSSHVSSTAALNLARSACAASAR